MKKRSVTIVLITNYWKGYLQSIAWMVVLGCGIAFAVWIESTAMQWAMAIVWFFSMIAWAVGESARMKRTPEQALIEIQKIIDDASLTPQED